jgi:hypothetical protein
MSQSVCGQSLATMIGVAYRSDDMTHMIVGVALLSRCALGVQTEVYDEGSTGFAE